MDKHYIFVTSVPFKRPSLLSLLAEAGVKRGSISFQGDTMGSFTAEASLVPSIDKVLTALHEDLGGDIGMLCSHGLGQFEMSIYLDALRYFPNEVCFPSDILLRKMAYGDFSFFGALAKIFRDIPGELLNTAKTYLICGLDAKMAAKKLSVHRNTFNYRLNAFIGKTDLDIRDFHNALLLQLYLDLSVGRSH